MLLRIHLLTLDTLSLNTCVHVLAVFVEKEIIH